MEIGLIAVDSKHPNLALMKISRYHKQKGDYVGWYNGISHYDKVYAAKVFTFTPDYGYFINADEVERDGSKHYDSNVSKYSQGKQVGYLRGFTEGAEYALQNQWISVEEALPDENEEVLCMMKSNRAIVSGYIYKENGIAIVATSPDFEFEDYGHYEAIAWMPRPELKTNDNG